MGEELDEIREALPFLIPLVILQVALMLVALVDLVRRERVRGGNKVIWGLVIVLVNIIGPIVYLLAGRLEGADGGDQD
jgi:hypothetical protein